MLLSTIRSGLSARLDAIEGMTVGDRPTNTPPVPYAWFSPPSAEFNATMGRGSDDFTYRVIVAVSHAVPEQSIREIEDYMSGHGALSVRAALESDGAVGDVLAGLAMVRVDSAEAGSEANPDGSFSTVTFTVAVTVDGRP